MVFAPCFLTTSNEISHHIFCEILLIQSKQSMQSIHSIHSIQVKAHHWVDFRAFFFEDLDERGRGWNLTQLLCKILKNNTIAFSGISFQVCLATTWPPYLLLNYPILYLPYSSSIPILHLYFTFSQMSHSTATYWVTLIQFEPIILNLVQSL